MADVAALLADLAEESAELDALVAPLDDTGWMTATPSAGWTVAHQIGHLAWTDDVAVLAVTEPDAFQEAVSASLAAGATAVDDAASARALTPPAELLSGWRTGRQRLIDALSAMRPGARIHWFGPPMSATSMATARLMETWAHGQDVADALGVNRHTTARLRHIAHLGVRARNFAFAVNEVDAPEDAFFVELTGPQGEVWSWGPADATQRVTGTATDFALLVTRRRHRADLALTAVGSDADRWLDLAQAFAGPPGEGRSPQDVP